VGICKVFGEGEVGSNKLNKQFIKLDFKKAIEIEIVDMRTMTGNGSADN
jgi:hypothetical protein